VESIALLLDKGAPPDVKDAAGVRPMEVASQAQYRGSRRHEVCIEMLTDVVQAKRGLSEGLQLQKKNSTQLAAHDALTEAGKRMKKWKLPHMNAEVAWATSSCELMLEKYGECMQSCAYILKSSISADYEERVRKRLEECKVRIRCLREKGLVEEAAKEATKVLRDKKLAEEAAKEASKASSPEAPQSNWTCQKCDEVNRPNRNKCNNCDCLKEDCCNLDKSSGLALVGDEKDDGKCNDEPETKATCVVCIDADALFLGVSCGHLSLCATCRRSSVHIELGEHGSKRHLSAVQLDRVSIACPVCRAYGGFVRFKGNRWRKGGNDEVWIPLEENASESLEGYNDVKGDLSSPNNCGITA